VTGTLPFIGTGARRRRCAKLSLVSALCRKSAPACGTWRCRSRMWRDYGLRGDGSVRLPDERAIAAAMRRHRIRYRDVGAAELLAEERIAGWSWLKRSNAELTRAVFGDPAPGRRLAAPHLPARGRSDFAPAEAGLPARGPYDRRSP
jgi:hypothetical protein